MCKQTCSVPAFGAATPLVATSSALLVLFSPTFVSLVSPQCVYLFEPRIVSTINERCLVFFECLCCDHRRTYLHKEWIMLILIVQHCRRYDRHSIAGRRQSGQIHLRKSSEERHVFVNLPMNKTNVSQITCVLSELLADTLEAAAVDALYIRGNLLKLFICVIISLDGGKYEWTSKLASFSGNR